MSCQCRVAQYVNHANQPSPLATVPIAHLVVVIYQYHANNGFLSAWNEQVQSSDVHRTHELSSQSTINLDYPAYAFAV
jgi:hypothetical protein